MASASQQSTPTMEQPPQQQQTTTTLNDNTNNTTATKRKPSRRANTAERRATHNAVERARRETLNGRFLDLAALLPNLSQIRRPSKSAIVNSSIAHIHASRRHRLLAARELRSLKSEADALRRELNEWRDRAALPRIEEPQRGEGFSMVLSGELEVINVSTADEDQDEDGDGLYEGGMEQQPFYHEADVPSAAMFAPHQAPPTPPTSSHGHPQHGAGMSMMPRNSMSNMHPMVVNSSQVHFDPAHPANMHGMPQFGGHSPHGHNVHFSHEQHIIPEQEKAWNMGFAAARQMHNHAPASNGPFQPNQPWHDMIPSDDSSSASSGGRARSGSLSTNGFGSPPRSPGSFDLGGYDSQNNYDLVPPSSNNGASEYGVPRGLSVNTSGLNGIGPQMVSSPVNVPTGGGGFGNVMMGMM